MATWCSFMWRYLIYLILSRFAGIELVFSVFPIIEDVSMNILTEKYVPTCQIIFFGFLELELLSERKGTFCNCPIHISSSVSRKLAAICAIILTGLHTSKDGFGAHHTGFILCLTPHSKDFLDVTLYPPTSPKDTRANVCFHTPTGRNSHQKKD